MWCVTGIRDKFLSFIFLVWIFCDKYFFVDYLFCDIIYILLLGLFLIVAIILSMIVHFSMIKFTFINFVIVVTRLFSLDYLVAVFLYLSNFVILVIRWYSFTFFMSEVLWFVPVFPARRAGTLVLGFYLKGFFIFYLFFISDCLFVQSYFPESLSRILLIVWGASSSSK